LARGGTMSDLAAAHARALARRFHEPIDLLARPRAARLPCRRPSITRQ